MTSRARPSAFLSAFFSVRFIAVPPRSPHRVNTSTEQPLARSGFSSISLLKSVSLNCGIGISESLPEHFFLRSAASTQIGTVQ